MDTAGLVSKIDKTYPQNVKYRVNSFPKDSFHIACISHRTRLQNILRAPGIDPLEKALLKQRHANLAAAQSGYIEKQKKAINFTQSPHTPSISRQNNQLTDD